MPNYLDQKAILANLAKFLKLKEQEIHQQYEIEKKQSTDANVINRLTQWQEELADHTNKLITFTEQGCCHGFSICRGAFKYAGFVRWWEHALMTLARWDQQPESLHQEIKLPNERLHKSANEPRTLGYLFERVLNYIVSNHNYFPFFAPYKMKQDNLLQPNNHLISEQKQSYFELATDQGVKTIQELYKVTGYFTHAQMNIIIDNLAQDTLDNKIMLLTNCNHTIQVDREKKSIWTVYNANYHHGDLSTIKKTLNNQSDYITEIFNLLGQAISIEIACFKKNMRVNLSIDYTCADLLKGEGLHLICREMPASTLIHIIHEAEKSLAFYTAFLDSLARKDPLQWTGLHVLIDQACCILPHLYELAKRSANSSPSRMLRVLIIDALKQKTPAGITGFDYIVCNAPNTLSALLKLIDSSKEGEKLCMTLANALMQKTCFHQTGLHLMAYHAPVALEELLHYFANDSSLANICCVALALALIKQDAVNQSGLRQLTTYAPQALIRVFKLASHSPEKTLLRNAIAIAISNENDPVWLESHFMPTLVEHALDILPDIVFFMLQKNPDNLHQLLSAFSLQDDQGKTTWQKIHVGNPTIPRAILVHLTQIFKNMPNEKLLHWREEIIKIRLVKKNQQNPFLFFQHSQTDMTHALLAILQNILQDHTQVSLPIKRKICGVHVS